MDSAGSQRPVSDVDEHGRAVLDAKGEPYTSIPIYFGLGHEPPTRLLITAEFKTAFADMKIWFNGFDVPPTVFAPEDFVWNRFSAHTTQHVDARSTAHLPTKGFILLGTPGIGKSLCLYYILMERLLSRRPTFFQTNPDAVTFWCEDGVFRIEARNVDLYAVFADNTPTAIVTADYWYLLDSNESLIFPNHHIRATRARVIQAASPQREHILWEGKENKLVCKWYMKPSPLKEHLAMRQFQKNPYTEAQYINFYNNFGPSARLLRRCAGRPRQYESELTGRIEKLDLAALDGLLTSTRRMKLDDRNVSHWIFGLYPGMRRNHIRLNIFTRHIYGLIKKAFGDGWQSQVRDVYRLLKSRSDTRSMTGYILEDQLHGLLTRGGRWHLTEMRSKSDGSKNNIYTAVANDSDPKYHLVLGPTAFVAALGTITPEDTPLDIYRYEENEEIDWYKPGYYQPISPNQAVIDSFVVDPQEQSVHVFQFAVSEDREVKDCGMAWLNSRYKDWKLHCIIFSDIDDIKVPISSTYDMIWTSRWHVRVLEHWLFP
ncbi:hypothetical protein C8Q75DRAFT_859541 [Abortiporus biennis]|nr:hypothetical protein C8Q75DRAFT_859541 [Abortiporus biennis]